MKLLNVLLILVVLTAMISVTTAKEYDIVRENEEYWNCVDYSVSFMRENPEWGCVTVSSNKYFKGVSHIMNYRIVENGQIEIKDNMYETNYILCGFENDTLYYHFWEGEPVRNYKWLRANSPQLKNISQINQVTLSGSAGESFSQQLKFIVI